jgi:hypothetical protein
MVYCTITMFNFSQFDHIWELCHVNHAQVPSGNQTWLAMDNPNYIYINGAFNGEIIKLNGGCEKIPTLDCWSVKFMT